MWLLSDLPNLGPRHCRAAVFHDWGVLVPHLAHLGRKGRRFAIQVPHHERDQALIDIYYGIGADHMGHEAWDAECERRIKALQETT